MAQPRRDFMEVFGRLGVEANAYFNTCGDMRSIAREGYLFAVYSTPERVKSSLPLLITVLARGSGTWRQLDAERDGRLFTYSWPIGTSYSGLARKE